MDTRFGKKEEVSPETPPNWGGLPDYLKACETFKASDRWIPYHLGHLPGFEGQGQAFRQRSDRQVVE